MYGGSGKLGRGGGGGGRGGSGAGKRNIHNNFHPPPLHRSTAAPSGRLPMSGPGPRGRTTTTTSCIGTSSSTGTEETFSLVTGNPLNFAMMIKLAPDLVEEIKRVEAEGGSARIKFDANANNPAGNVIDVGGKDFRFTWSREPGELCDIYEEHRSGEDGNGMLVESGCPWRKLNVQRVLDESTKNHVKMRSEEAEKKNNSRKAIVLDPGNPLMRSQAKAMAAVEANQWRMGFKQKKEPPFKKQKTDAPPGRPLKAMYKSGLSTTPSKGRQSTSPGSPLPEQSVPPGSPFGSGSSKKGRPSVDSILGPQATNKTLSSEKEMPSKVISSGGKDNRGHKSQVAKPTDLRSMLISLLKENPQGMSFKALEKAVGEAFPNSIKQIEPIIKKIANLQAPGKYLLKPEAELEGFKMPSAANGSSPSDNRQKSPVDAKYDQLHVPEPQYPMRTDGVELEELGQLDSKPGEVTTDSERIDIGHHSPDLSGEKKISDREGRLGNSSDSGSDSDSDSDSSDNGSDSGSRSRSRSKSKSPVGSRSGSSSDSESDASSNSKQASDEDVDIMTSDDDKDLKQNLQDSELGAKSPFDWIMTDAKTGKMETDDKKDDDVDVVELDKDLPGDDHVGQMVGVTSSVSNKEGCEPEEETKLSSPGHNEHHETEEFGRQSHIERGNAVWEDPKHEQPGIPERISKSKSKRGSKEKNSDVKPDRTRRLKPSNLDQPLATNARNPASAESPYNPSPDRYNDQTASDAAREDAADFQLQKAAPNQGTYRKSNFETQQAGGRSYDPSARTKAPAAVDRPGKHAEGAGEGGRYSEKGSLTNDGFPLQKEKINRDNDDSSIKDKRSTKFSREGIGEKSTPGDSHYGKRDMLDKFKETGSISNMQTSYSSKDENINNVNKSTAENGWYNKLRREPSDLELGELREPLPDETPGYKKPFERKSSFKKSDNQPTSSEYWNLDSTKGKPTSRVSSEYRETLNASKTGSGTLEDTKRKSFDYYANDSTRYHGAVQHPPEQNQSRIDRTEPGSRFNKLAEMNANNIESDAGLDLGTTSLRQQHDSRRTVAPLTLRENKKPQPSTSIDDRRKDTSLTESNDGGHKRRESSSDENSCSYSKYEKEEPEMKGPIKDLLQYEEYVQEYMEKYEIYLSLSKILESYRNDFMQLGNDLEASKGRDMQRYYDLLAQLKESYRQCGEKHKRFKKIFLVLHEELKRLKQMMKDFAATYPKD